MTLRIFGHFTLLILVASALPTSPARAQNEARLDAQSRRAILDSLASQLRRFYVRPAVAESLIARLRQRGAAGVFDKVVDPATMATRLTAEIHSVVKDDAHLTVRYSAPEPVPTVNGVPLDEAAIRRRERAAFIQDAHDEAFGIPEVRTLPGNVGYLRIGEFLYQTMMGAEQFSRPAVIAAMQLVADRDALIIDLRENRGGHTTVPGLLLSYLFDQPISLGSSRQRDGQVSTGMTFEVPGPKFGGSKPLFVLTSDSTFSAGEAIAAILQEGHRGIVVGARTRGGANSGDFHSIGSNLRAFIPDTQNSRADGSSVESVGVAPNVAVTPKQAFDVAYGLALDSLAHLSSDSTRRAKLEGLAKQARAGQKQRSSV